MLIGELLNNDPDKLTGEIFNAGTNVPHSVKDVLEIIFSQIGNSIELEEVISLMKDKKTSGEIETQFMDFEKANKFTGWKPSHSLEEGLSKTIDWYIKYLRK